MVIRQTKQYVTSHNLKTKGKVLLATDQGDTKLYKTKHYFIL